MRNFINIQNNPKVIFIGSLKINCFLGVRQKKRKKGHNLRLNFWRFLYYLNVWSVMKLTTNIKFTKSLCFIIIEILFFKYRMLVIQDELLNLGIVQVFKGSKQKI